MPGIIQPPPHAPQLPPPGWRDSDGLSLPPHADRVSLECGGTIMTSTDRRRSAAFNPATLGASLWLVSDTTYATTDTAGTTAVSATSQAVANVRNRGTLGSAADGVQSTVNARPVVQQLSPLRLTLDGSDDYVPIGSSAIVVASVSRQR